MLYVIFNRLIHLLGMVDAKPSIAPGDGEVYETDVLDVIEGLVNECWGK